ncbi:MAG: 2OG-Fe(II) oxygenase [Burkholderiales bacterium]|nr:MAG: 2OG-Fe(II) oxygenase [Burkholderiales bacterium]
MSNPATKAAFPAPLPAQWQDWIATNVVRGCSDADLLDVMREQGFEPAYASVAISVVRAMTVRVRAGVPGLLEGARADRLPAAMAGDAESTVSLLGEPARIVFSLHEPNVALLEGMLSDSEGDELIALAAGRLERSEVVDRDTGRFEVSGVRTSEGTHFVRGEYPVVDRLERRVAALTGRPVEHGEPLQILRYRVGGEYLPHHDYFDPGEPGTPTLMAQGGQRIATLVLYLNDVPAGGETAFPEIDLVVRPRRGAAVYFDYLNQAGLLDARLLHAGRPVRRGEKWIATKWIRQDRY